MSNYKIGSSGTGVEELQRKLNEKGNYALEVDGQYGAKTEQAVKDFQKSNGLTVDGIVGNETKGALGISSAAAAPTTNSVQKSTAPTSNAVSPAKQQLSMLQKGYSSPLDDAINGLYDSVFNQSKATFDYDVSGDPAYNQYAETYKRNAKLMSEDALAQASALTGGYGSSYGQAVASQAYNEQLSKMNDIVPELRQNAYNEWNDKRAKEIEALTLLLNERDRERSIYESDRAFEESVRQYNENLKEDQRRYDTGLLLDEQDRLDRREELAMNAGFSSWDEFKNAIASGYGQKIDINDFDSDYVSKAVEAWKTGGIEGLQDYFTENMGEYSIEALDGLGKLIQNTYPEDETGRKVIIPQGVERMNSIAEVRDYLKKYFSDVDGSLDADSELFLSRLLTYNEMSSDNIDDEFDRQNPDQYSAYLTGQLKEYLRNRK